MLESPDAYLKKFLVFSAGAKADGSVGAANDWPNRTVEQKVLRIPGGLIMAQRKQLTWSELRVGVFVLVGITAVIVGGIFYVTGTGACGSQYRLVTYLPEVDGLATGAPVTLDGVEVGNVDSIRMARPAAGAIADPSQSRPGRGRVRIDRDFQDYIRTDSTATCSPKAFSATASSRFSAAMHGPGASGWAGSPRRGEKAMNQIVDHGAD